MDGRIAGASLRMCLVDLPRVLLLLCVPPGSHRHAELKNPARAKCENDNRSEHHREQQRHREGQVPMEDQKVHVHALQVLKDEYEDQHQGHDADDKRCPRPAEPGLSLARERFPRFYILVSGTFHRPNLALNHITVERKCAGAGTRTPDPRFKSPSRPPQDASPGLLPYSILRPAPPRGSRDSPGLAIQNGYTSEGPWAIAPRARTRKGEAPHFVSAGSVDRVA